MKIVRLIVLAALLLLPQERTFDREPGVTL